jgi:hypothetical protein
MHAYNLFRCKEQGIYCAVPEDRIIPRFVRGRSWEFGGKLEHGGAAPVGFVPQAATAGVRFNGFYVFQAYSGA